MEQGEIAEKGGQISENQMSQTKLIYSKKEVQRAGEALIVNGIQQNDPDAYRDAMVVLSNWRASHENVLHRMTSALEKVSSQIDNSSIVVKRLKRAQSIIKKLRRFDKMKLRNMQDIAGCRAILSTTKIVYKVKKELNKNKNFIVKDYIGAPKPDGYRGIHLICKMSDHENGLEFPVEVQLRSRMQHAWATAVEIVDLFTNQALKSNQGKQDWLDFFQYVSQGFCRLEGINVRGSESPLEELERISYFINRLEIYKKFEAYASYLKFAEDSLDIDSAGYQLIKIDFSRKQVEEVTLQVSSFSSNHFDKATESYLKLEKEAAKKSLVVALVSSSSIGNLKEAYPNFFADSRIFINNLRELERLHKEAKPHWLANMLWGAGFKDPPPETNDLVVKERDDAGRRKGRKRKK